MLVCSHVFILIMQNAFVTALPLTTYWETQAVRASKWTQLTTVPFSIRKKNPTNTFLKWCHTVFNIHLIHVSTVLYCTPCYQLNSFGAQASFLVVTLWHECSTISIDLLSVPGSPLSMSGMAQLWFPCCRGDGCDFRAALSWACFAPYWQMLHSSPTKAKNPHVIKPEQRAANMGEHRDSPWQDPANLHISNQRTIWIDTGWLPKKDTVLTQLNTKERRNGSSFLPALAPSELAATTICFHSSRQK